jgi:DNA-directed RNA polymerase sigma subunit (sigma70/sigma32)|tara:strand:- start:3518 stop:3754 length:237 start_codon:yes stop_codon:yes gene_type:complete
MNILYKLLKILRSTEYLSPKERKVLEYRFGFTLGNVKTLEQTGREFGVTRERIRQIESKALLKIWVKLKGELSTEDLT